MYNNKFVNNIDLNEILQKYKHIINGLKTIEDRLLLMNKFTLSDKEKKLLISYINSKKIEKSIDYNAMKKIMCELLNMKYREDVNANMSQLMNRSTNLAQIKTFIRIANSKPLKPIILPQQRETQNNIAKNCPHCDHKCYANQSTDYIICGYTEHGYDWIGCGQDWCFKCDKILCKLWDQDELYIEENRCHDNECCSKHAEIHNKKYPDDYCNCDNNYVKRNPLKNK